MEVLILTLFFLSVTCEEKVNNTGTLEQNTNKTKCDILTDVNNRVITDIDKVCGPSKPCFTKCCGVDELLFMNRTGQYCLDFDQLNKVVNTTKSVLDYSDYTVMDKDIYKKGPVVTNKNLKKDFNIIVNKQLINGVCGTIFKLQYYLLEDGRFVVLKPNAYNMWTETKSSSYCIDKLVNRKFPQGRYLHFVKIVESEESSHNSIFEGVGLLISAFFLLLVLLVYSVLKQLRNIQGMVLMAYVATLAIAFLLKAGLQLGVANNTTDEKICQRWSPVCYIFILSSFFWLNIMSFDIWWTFRGLRKVRSIHRQGEVMKFIWYGVYAWGVPTILGIGAYCVDSVIDLTSSPSFIKPQFQSCFQHKMETILYLHIPIIIMTGFNTLLFFMTIYNIWLINRNIARFGDAKPGKIKKDRNSFCLYIKICALMGVNWIMEVLQQIPERGTYVWLTTLLNVYNVFIGVVIFYMFVLNSSTLKKLCERFNIDTKFSKRNVSLTRSTECSRKAKSSNKTKNFDTIDIDDSKTEVTKSYLPDDRLSVVPK